ncbi:uncharacterized protein BT62DRAFT_1003588 [Guyanagaster necrorhizus]|uniref:Uncharacterized protein n=1 Tax=Guyanagaster necrorhizus TaxID=856835 RepID=A0A9P8AV87_9AGAR|nr:uncharacterized protein BT62DRAFT_1003588 [Guyanagaster necrorhizus MCA 3950]KAG7448866.1 hypothetical protein BT62DRAFT_1003588 [Guyanagaster necrorhizus MCA 3950]
MTSQGCIFQWEGLVFGISPVPFSVVWYGLGAILGLSQAPTLLMKQQDSVSTIVDSDMLCYVDVLQRKIRFPLQPPLITLSSLYKFQFDPALALPADGEKIVITLVNVDV